MSLSSAPIDIRIAVRSAQLQTDRSMQVEDTLIATTALLHRMVLVTRNVEHFKDTGIKIINHGLVASNMLATPKDMGVITGVAMPMISRRVLSVVVSYQRLPEQSTARPSGDAAGSGL